MKRILPVLLGVFLIISFSIPALAALPVHEILLNQNGEAFEINSDDEGWLWISDWIVSEVWRVNPATGAHIIYKIPGMYVDPGDPTITYGSPVDARKNGNFFWWVDYTEYLIGRAEVTDGDSNGLVAYTLWTVPDLDPSYFWGTTLDSAGRLWTSDGWHSKFYRLTVNSAGTSGEICIFDIPDSGLATYLTYDDPYIWLGDYFTPRLLRLNVNDNTYDWYQLPASSSPLGMAVDDEGDLWYADQDNPELAELDPDSHLLFRYSIPQITFPPVDGMFRSFPLMIAIQQQRIWYSANSKNINDNFGNDTIGVLDSTGASYLVNELDWGDGTLVPDCGPGPIQPYDSGDMAIVTSDNLSWTASSYETLLDADGWHIYKALADVNSWTGPYGVAQKDGKVYVVDNGWQKLVEIDSPLNSAELTLTLTGNPATYDNVGDVINYTYLLTNSGSVDLVAPFTVSATKVNGAAICPSTPTLAVGNTVTCTGSYTITQADLDAGSVISIASAKAFFGLSEVNSNTDSTRIVHDYNVFLPLILR